MITVNQNNKTDNDLSCCTEVKREKKNGAIPTCAAGLARGMRTTHARATPVDTHTQQLAAGTGTVTFS